MVGRLSLSDRALERAGELFVSASRGMSEGSTPPPTQEIETLTGIGAQVMYVLQGMKTGRQALADAAKTASAEVAAIMQQSATLDAVIAAELQPGFAVTGGGQ